MSRTNLPADLSPETKIVYVKIDGVTKGTTYEMRVGGRYSWNSELIGRLYTGIHKGTSSFGGGIFGWRTDKNGTPSKIKSQIKTLGDLMEAAHEDLVWGKDDDGTFFVGPSHYLMPFHLGREGRHWDAKHIDDLTPVA